MNLDQIENALSALNKLQGLPAAGLLFIFCLAVGYAWRGLKFKWCPNDAIPIVVMLTGAVGMMLIADGRPTTEPKHVWTARNFFVGFVIGAIAWAVHNYVLYRVEDWIASKFPSIGNTAFFKKSNSPPNPVETPPKQP